MQDKKLIFVSWANKRAKARTCLLAYVRYMLTQGRRKNLSLRSNGWSTDTTEASTLEATRGASWLMLDARAPNGISKAVSPAS